MGAHLEYKHPVRAGEAGSAPLANLEERALFCCPACPVAWSEAGERDGSLCRSVLRGAAFVSIEDRIKTMSYSQY